MAGGGEAGEEEEDDQRKPTLVFPMRDVAAACAGDEAAAQPGCISVHRSLQVQKSNGLGAAATRPSGRVLRGSSGWGLWMQLSCSTGAGIAAAPSRVACCSRSLLGQSVTRQVGAAGRSIAPSSQVLPVIPMPGGERSWRTAATLFLLQLQFFGDCSLGWICNKRVRPQIVQSGMESCPE